MSSMVLGLETLVVPRPIVEGERTVDGFDFGPAQRIILSVTETDSRDGWDIG